MDHTAEKVDVRCFDYCSSMPFHGSAMVQCRPKYNHKIVTNSNVGRIVHTILGYESSDVFLSCRSYASNSIND